eukprot:10100951-Heterocapsa_arctica.AAC.1
MHAKIRSSFTRSGRQSFFARARAHACRPRACLRAARVIKSRRARRRTAGGGRGSLAAVGVRAKEVKSCQTTPP